MPPKPTPPQKRKDRNPTTNPVEDEHDGAGPSNDLDTSKRVPGRPRGSKTASDAAVNSGPPATDGEPALKRPRGRPKKIRTEEEVREMQAKANRPRGKRGRPRKKRPEDEEGEGADEQAVQGTEGTGVKPPSRGPDAAGGAGGGGGGGRGGNSSND